MHYMIDIEALDTRPTAAVLTIGVAKFDKDGVHDELYLKPDYLYQLSHGRTRSSATYNWWMSNKVPAAARDEAFGLYDRDFVDNALCRLREFITADASHRPQVWGNGAGFDNVILEHLFDQYNVLCPWRFRENRCARTMFALFYPRKSMQPKFEGDAHNALDDARNQALRLININNRYDFL